MDTSAPISHPDPARELIRAIAGPILSRVIIEVTALGVPDALAGGPRTAVDLATEVGADAETLGRLLRFLVAHGVMDEPCSGQFALNEQSDLLRTDVPGSLAAHTRLHRNVMLRVLEHLGDTIRTGEVAFDRTFGATFYEHLAGHPDLDADFNAVMTGRAAHIGRDLADCIDWTGIETVVDVGGNRGDLLIELLRGAPGGRGATLRGTVFDQPHIELEAIDAIACSGLADRLAFEGGDFFLRVPEGADRYLLANVLWNWPDDQAEMILATIAAAIEPSGRVVIVEPVMPAGSGLHPAKGLDIANMLLMGGRTRTLEEWDRLLAATGFERVAVRESLLGWTVIEAEPRPVAAR